jgi:hypothetical protein
MIAIWLDEEVVNLNQSTSPFVDKLPETLLFVEMTFAVEYASFDSVSVLVAA